MAIVYTYPQKAVPVNDDLVLISDSADDNKTKQVKISSLPGATASGVTSITVGSGTSTGSAFTTSGATGALTLTTMAYDGTTNVGHVPTGGNGTTFLRGDGTWVIPTNTTYTAGNGIDGAAMPVITADLYTQGGIIFDGGELRVALDASNMSGELGVNFGGTGLTSLTDGHIMLGSGVGPITMLDVTVKGSILVGDGATDPIALPVGIDTYVLTANSATASGLAWQANTAGMTNWILSDNSNTQTISDGNTVKVLGSAPINTTVSATDTVTIGHNLITTTPTTTTPAQLTHGGTFPGITTVTHDAYGNLTGYNTATYMLPASAGFTGYDAMPLALGDANSVSGPSDWMVFYQIICPNAFTCNRASIYVTTTGSATFKMAIYSGVLTDLPNTVKLGEDETTTFTTAGIKTFELTEVSAGDLNLTKGQQLILGFYQTGGDKMLVYNGYSAASFCIDTSNDTAFPAALNTLTGPTAAEAHRPCCTLFNA